MILISFTFILFCLISAKSISAECTTQNICECGKNKVKFDD